MRGAYMHRKIKKNQRGLPRGLILINIDMFLNLFHFVIGFYPGILYQVYVANKFNALTKYSKNYAQLKRIQISCQKSGKSCRFHCT